MSNVQVGEVTEIVDGTDVTVTNKEPAYGGTDGMTVDEIKQNAKSFLSENEDVRNEVVSKVRAFIGLDGDLQNDPNDIPKLISVIIQYFLFDIKYFVFMTYFGVFVFYFLYSFLTYKF